MTEQYSVNEDCINCNLCVEIAPDVFEINEDAGRSVVKKQPKSEDQIELADEALSSCPVNAILKQ